MMEKSISMKRVIGLSSILLSLTVPISVNGMEPGKLLSLYPKGLTFDVIRKDDVVGRHTVTFKYIGSAELQVNSVLNLKITVLSIPIYRYQYTSNSTWKSGRMIRLQADQDDNGSVSRVSALIEKNFFVIKGPENKIKTAKFLFPTNHWHAGVVGEKEVLNTLTGNIANVRISPGPTERILAQDQLITATPYRYTGDIETTVWYDRDGRWVKMAFIAKGGTHMKYYCVECGLGLDD